MIQKNRQHYANPGSEDDELTLERLAQQLIDRSKQSDETKNYFARCLKISKHYINDIIDLLSYKPIYTKKAIGLNGEEILVYKIRTMIKDADKLAPLIFNIYTKLDHQGKPRNDPRITRLGRRMRKYHIDELPQLYNVFIKRNMNFFGIRPMEKEVWGIYPNSLYERTIKSKPGLIPPTYAIPEERCSSDKDGKSVHFAIIRLYHMQHDKNPIRTNVKFTAAGVYNKLRGEHSS